jgi:hypothetical protein
MLSTFPSMNVFNFSGSWLLNEINEFLPHKRNENNLAELFVFQIRSTSVVYFSIMNLQYTWLHIILSIVTRIRTIKCM